MGDNKGPKPSDNVVNNAHQNNALGMRLFLFAMVFVVVFFTYITFFHPHTSPDQVANQIKAAETSEVKAVAPTAPAAVANEKPWVSTPEQVAKGAELYKTNCALCHGDKGTGDGPAGAALNPKPRNYTDGKWKFGNSAVALFNTITNGSPGTSMAGYGGLLSVGDRWAVVHFVRSIGKNIVDPSEAEIKSYTEKKN